MMPTSTGLHDSMEYGWRVDKYDPRICYAPGSFLWETWTSISDIGQSWGGEQLTREQYVAMEDRYVAAALYFVHESGVGALQVTTLERHSNSKESLRTTDATLLHALHVQEGQYVSGDLLERVCRLNLRDMMWCKLEQCNRFYLHFGYDLDMYVGAEQPLVESVAYARHLSHFIEPMHSPHG